MNLVCFCLSVSAGEIERERERGDRVQKAAQSRGFISLVGAYWMNHDFSPAASPIVRGFFFSEPAVCLEAVGDGSLVLTQGIFLSADLRASL